MCVCVCGVCVCGVCVHTPKISKVWLTTCMGDCLETAGVVGFSPSLQAPIIFVLSSPTASVSASIHPVSVHFVSLCLLWVNLDKI